MQPMKGKPVVVAKMGTARKLKKSKKRAPNVRTLSMGVRG